MSICAFLRSLRPKKDFGKACRLLAEKTEKQEDAPQRESSNAKASAKRSRVQDYTIYLLPVTSQGLVPIERCRHVLINSGCHSGRI